MKAFKTKWFGRWARREDLGDSALANAMAEMERGLIDAQLGGQVVKKRVPLPGRGKRGSTRILVAFRQGEKAFFIYGFAKNERSTVSNDELDALKILAKEFLSYGPAKLAKAINAGELIKIKVDDDG